MSLPAVPVFGIDLVPFGLAFVNLYALYLAISLSLNLEFGYAGIPNFGKVLFIAGGASVAASVSGRLSVYVFGITHGDFIINNTTIILQVDVLLATHPMIAVELLLIGLLIGAAIGAIFGFVFSYPAIRLREDYLGMLLLGSAQFFQVILRTWDQLIGGVQNINVPDPYYYWSTCNDCIGYRDLVAAIVITVFAILVFVYSERVARSPLGRTLRAVRDNEDAARALGKDDVSMRRRILIISSGIAGMAGVFFTFYIASAEYDTWSRFLWTFFPFLIVIIGGSGNNVGVFVGTLFFAASFRGLQQLQPFIRPYIFFDVNFLQDILFAALLVVILLLRPEGIVKEKSTLTLPRRRLNEIIQRVGGGAAEVNIKAGGRSFVDRFRRLRKTGG